ncbi:hypothetical protein AVEN_215535-1 [Araneus ventricosus]|uniref:PiggyBac transposable element-derived protein domain-containing protein n=1 Tax=Araneus ventricosus TaxID=182803 RepID=A0A4Y2BI17_ARAVE|nr:hypothetical protein AVEN_215535-1 [Araneus ventricosus]
MPTPFEKEMERLHKLLAEVETDEDSDFDNEDNGAEDIDHENFSEHDTESEREGDSGNEEVNNSEWFSSKDSVHWRETKFRQNISYLLSYYCVALTWYKRATERCASPVKSWESFIHDNTIQLIVEFTNIFIEKSALNFSRERDARKTNPLEICAL